MEDIMKKFTKKIISMVCALAVFTCDCSIANYVWSKANFSKYARYSIFLPAASYDSAMCAYDSNFGWDRVCDTKVSV